jgi:hypothetical protein
MVNILGHSPLHLEFIEPNILNIASHKPVSITAKHAFPSE